MTVGLCTALGLLPLLLGSNAPVAARVAIALLVATSCAASALTDRWRGAAAVLGVLWLAGSVTSATDGPVTAVAVAAGLVLRLWCGLPELLAVGRRVGSDLGLDLAGGAAAAALVVAVARTGPGLPAVTVVASAVGLVTLAVLALRGVRG